LFGRWLPVQEQRWRDEPRRLIEEAVKRDRAVLAELRERLGDLSRP
jgi:hypothetical protein